MIIVFLIAIASTASLSQAQSLSRPSVTLPSGWSLADDTPYPNVSSIHDPAGAGMLLYLRSLNGIDEVRIYYEKAPDINFTDSTIKAEAEVLYAQHTHGSDMNISGVAQTAGVQAGFAKHTSVYSDFNFTIVVRAFVKENYYFRVIEYYSITGQSTQQVNSIVNSISISTSDNTPTPSSYINTPTPDAGSSGGDPMILLVIGVALAIGLATLTTAIVMRRRKKDRFKRKIR